MKKVKNFINLALFGIASMLFNFQCGSSEKPPSKQQCNCPILQEGNDYLQVRSYIESYKGNANKEDFERDDIIKVEGNAEADVDIALKKNLNLKGGLKVVFPKSEDNEKNLTIYTLRPGTPDNYQKIFLFYCMKYYNYAGPDCIIPNEKKEKFSSEMDEIFKRLFLNATEDTHLMPESSDGSVGIKPIFKNLPNMLGINCNGDKIFITRDNINLLIDNISFVKKEHLSLKDAENNFTLICNESDHANKSVKIFNAMSFKYITQHNLENMEPVEIKKIILGE